MLLLLYNVNDEKTEIKSKNSLINSHINERKHNSTDIVQGNNTQKVT